MPSVITTEAIEKGTYVVTAVFADEDATALTPDTITWSLFNGDGDTINSRAAVSIAVPAASNNIVLSGDDLLVSDGRRRVLLIEATYTSTYGGAGMPLREEVSFDLLDLINV